MNIKDIPVQERILTTIHDSQQEDKSIMNGKISISEPEQFKTLYLIAVNETGNQTAIIFKHWEVSGIPVLELVHDFTDLYIKVTSRRSKVRVQHHEKYISGEIAINGTADMFKPLFDYNRETFELTFHFNATYQSYKIMECTAIPLIQLIARM